MGTSSRKEGRGAGGGTTVYMVADSRLYGDTAVLREISCSADVPRRALVYSVWKNGCTVYMHDSRAVCVCVGGGVPDRKQVVHLQL